MKKIYLVLLILVSISVQTSAQQNMQDVIYLLNGNVVRGEVIDQEFNKSITIQRAVDSNIFVFKMQEIKKITKEVETLQNNDSIILDPHNYYTVKDTITNITNISKLDEVLQKSNLGNTKAGNPQSSNDSVVKIKRQRKKEFSNITEIGSMIGFGHIRGLISRTENNYIFSSLTTINGYKLNQRCFLGLGVGIESSKYLLDIPIFGDIRVNMLKRKVTPVFDLGIGYTINAMNRQRDVYFKKGNAFANAQVGMKIDFAKHFAWLIGFGYRLQFNHISLSLDELKTTGILNGFVYYPNSNLPNPLKASLFSHYISVKTGFAF